MTQDGGRARALYLVALLAGATAQVLTPPYFNLAENRFITSSATCGEDVAEPELYCKLVGAKADRVDASSDFIHGGQWCDRCDPNLLDKSHPVQFAIDGSERWWQSPPLSRGMKYNEVNLTIDLGQLFQVAYILIKMGNSPRPGVWVLERSVDNGEIYTPWQYFADSLGDCESFFGKESLEPIREDDDVTCVTHFSKVVPLEGGEIVVSLLNNRPSANSFFNSTVLQEFTRATNVRLRLLRTKTLLAHLMSVARQDPTVTRRYFYSIKDISIGGRCVCNGHADVCDITDPNDLYKLQCRCQHNTCGSRCEMCCPGFIQKKWRPAGYQGSFVCEPCNCYDHSNECIYSEEVNEQRLSRDIYGQFEGGGVCQNCQHNTQGINCDQCISGYYRPFDRDLNDTDVCQPCNCNEFFSTGNCATGTGQCECRLEFLPPYCDECNDGYYDYPNCKPCDCHRSGTIGGICEVGGGQCPCKDNYEGLNCNRCAPNYYNFPDCLPCNCSDIGSLDYNCNAETGQCNCQNEFGGQICDRCEHGFYDYPTCTFCNCDAQGTVEEKCNKETGECLCLSGFGGNRCDNSAAGFYGYPYIQSCGCHEIGSSSSICDASGGCTCIQGFSGRACDQCSPGYYNFPECVPCNCDQAGSIGISCDRDGKCQCKPHYDGVHCDKCLEGFYNFPLCEECNCNPAGVIESFGGCGEAPVGELCECKERVTGRICDRCKSLFWDLRQDNPFGCEECGCHTPGTIGGMALCESVSGQCICKPGVTSRQCNQCRDGTYNLVEDNMFGCSECGCISGGSVDNICDRNTGQCRCRPRVTGQHCDQPMQLHYFPTLYQLKYEAEDGHTPQNTAVRFAYDEEVFPNYSWRGYAVFSDIQKEIIQEIYIEKPSLYLLVMFYHNPSSKTIVGKIKVTPDNPSDTEQEIDVHFAPTNGPQLMTVKSVLGDFPVPLVMNPGQWSVAIKNKKNLFLDYFVLLPLAYYEGTILSRNVTTPCMIGHVYGDMCIHYAYPDIFEYNYIYGSAGYRSVGDERESVELFDDYEVLSELDTQPMAWLNHNQPSVQYDIRLSRPGRHILLINYFTPEGGKTTNIMIETSTRRGREKGRAILYDCMYSTTCRQVITDASGKVGVFYFDSNFISLEITGETNTNIGIDSIVAVPYEYWHEDLVRPQPVCTRLDGQCLESSYPIPPESVKVEFESNFEGKMSTELPYGVANGTGLVYLNHSDPMVDITGKLRYAGKYVFVVHYYQPQYPEFDVDVLIQNGQFYEGSLAVHHCPSTSGCRSVIRQPDGSYVFDILENFVLSLKEPNHKSIWVDKVLVVPAQQFNEKIMHEMPIDMTADFINICGQNNFNIGDNATDFCKAAAYELTMEYNSGALPCQCDFYGSESFECESFGGQCPCRRNVIGRRCNRCKTGYFGFPDCEPCNCPSTALCDPVTGECICPPRVEGNRCQRCAPYTYGFDPIIGCEECQCSALGVQSGNLQCDLQTGQCSCKNSVVGRRCERCAAGFWSFPFCQLCDCDLRGTEEDICSQDDASCYCKLNVEGRSCDMCRPGSYNLEETNPDGCTKCFCFGKSEYCSSADVYWEGMLIDDMSAWSVIVVEQLVSSPGLSSQSLTALSFSSLDQQPTYYKDLIQQDMEGVDKHYPEGQIFFTAPAAYLGNHVSSYGGYLRYSIVIVWGDEGSKISGPDVILRGGDILVQYFSPDLPFSSQVLSAEIRLTEHNFRTMSGFPVQREQFMMLLYELDAIFIRASYWSNAIEARLFNTSIDVPTAEWLGRESQPALSVERCQCPINYEGLSCEDCARGYYRAQRGPYGGYCVPCQCNGHAGTCDKETGKCLNCLHNTVGDNCEMCAPGYHGKATQGTPYDCLICACPMPSITNNFAESCDFLDDGFSIKCECQEGYIGERCERCAAGYHGQPEVLGDRCEACTCNGNIDVRDSFSCDDITGRCLACLNNTYGNSCERCAPGYYGDAINLKNCESCTCDECGTRNCQHFSGVCECFDNVIGNQCGQCAPDHWGFASCQGCQPCQCGIASLTSQCDEGTGQCHCTGGVTGQRCDHCMPGFWNYTRYGCQECTCREGFSVGVGCNPRTGQCQCLPGVIGTNCEGCPYRWVLVDGVGCQECEECVHALLDTTDELAWLIQPTINEFETAAYSFFLHQRLGVINSTLYELRPQVNLLDLSEAENVPLEGDLNSIMKEAQSVSAQSEHVLDRAGGAATDSFKIHVKALRVREDVDDAFNSARGIIGEINRLVIGLETGTGAQLEQAIREAEAVVEEMKKRSSTEQLGKVEEEKETAEELLDSMGTFFEPIKGQRNTLTSYQEHLTNFENKIKEMRDYIQKATQQTTDAEHQIRNNKLYGYKSLKKKLEEIRRLDRVIAAELEESQNLVDQANGNHINASANYELLVMEIEHLRAVKSTLDDSVTVMMKELEEAQYPAQRAEGHAEQLGIRAEELDELLADTREVAENALAAANAYKNIVFAIDDAYNASLSANMSAQQAVEKSEGLSDQALVSQTQSEEKSGSAEVRAQQVEKELRPQLTQAQLDVSNLKDMNLYISDNLAVIESKLNSLDEEAVSTNAAKLKEAAVSSREEADGAIQNIASVEGKLPGAAEDARLLMRNRAEAGKAIELASKQVERVQQAVPMITELAARLRLQKEQIQTTAIDVGDRLEKLRRTIQKTRELSNKIKVGVSFQPNTTIEVQNPEDLTKATTSTKLSVFVQTEEPSGLLLFMGTPVGGSQRMRRTTTDDFMALEMDRGFVRLTMDLGAGAHSIEYNKLYIADGVWSKITVERTGKLVKLSVHREEMEGEPVEQVLPGRFSVFNLDPKVSKIYVGGIPAGVEVNSAIRSTSYYGQMEDLRLNDQPIGLWNFMMDGTNNIEQRGAVERDRLVDLVPPTGLRFDGNGYAALDTRNGYRFRMQFDVQMDFKTYLEDGILFIIDGGPRQYMVVAMEEGHVIFQYNLGSGVVTLKSADTYHDGEWYHVEATRHLRNGVLKIASETIQEQSPGHISQFSSTPDTMYFGGYPGEHDFREFTNEDFNGCIDNIVMSSVAVDLSTNKESINTAPGCPIKVASLVSFDKTSSGYVKHSSPEGSGLQLVFKFKTDEPDGLILYTSTMNQDSYLSLSLAESALILRAFPGGELTTGTYDKYNDSEWHVVIATREHNELRLDIDDFKSYKVKVPEQAVQFDGPVYFGGVPEFYNIAAAASAIDTNFFGCIGDVTLNSQIVNFAESRERPNAHLQNCPLQKSSSFLEKPSVGQEGMRINVSDYEEVPIIAEPPSFPDVVEVDLSTSSPPSSTSETSDLFTSFSAIPTSPTTSSTISSTTTSTTTTMATTTEEIRPEITQPVPLDGCALPEDPAEEDVPSGEGFRFDEDFPSGYNFGSKRNSRIQFQTLPDNPRADFKFSFDFKTLTDEGVIFYASSLAHRDYITMYLKDNKIVFGFDTGTGAAIMRSEQFYNNGEWHSVIVERREEYGMLFIDGYQVANGTGRGDSKYIDVEQPFYYGGISSDVANLVQQNTEGTEISFNGCLRNFRMNNQRVGGGHDAFSLIRCSANVEAGVFFGYGPRSHVILRKRFSVGRVFEMTMDIKPRTIDGVLASVHGRRDFVMLHLKNGTVELSVDNGKGIITAKYTPPSPWMLCDGKWHSIQLIKNKNIAILVVDETSTVPVSGKIGATSTDTKNPLFLGSQPHVQNRRGGASDKKFIGCVRNVTVNKDPVALAYTTFVGNVNAGSCPTI
ncbi:laminin subunit alpha-like isoform X1 [Homarus americanus]|uniref:laminin subunit alpha-like isoform X1 n=1 Tax=Homarus americanus TaxID=6706 RepID=UPI001C46B6EB|nr:laminin subunit alpha-like isoform X1 [Homarus americanus]